MDKQKQIEEIAKDLCKNASPCTLVDWGDCERKADCGKVCMQAKTLYDLGYRKIPENAVVLTREEYDDLIKGRANLVCSVEVDTKKVLKEIQEYIGQVRKETAEKFAERLKELLKEREYKTGCSAHMLWTDTAEKCIDEICKELGGEL